MASDDPPRNVLPFRRPQKASPPAPRDPRFADFLHSLMEMVWGADFGPLATVFDGGFDLEAGLAWAEDAIAHGNPEGHAAKATLLNLRAYRTLVRGDADAALAEWDALIAAHPEDLDAHVMRARFHERRGDDAAAAADLDRAVQLAPTDVRGYLRRAVFYESKGDGPRSLANFRRAVQLDPESNAALVGLGRRLAAEGDAKGATRAYAKAAEQELGDAESYQMRGLMHFVSDQIELALADYDAAVALAPHEPDGLRWRGLCRLRLNRLDGAFADFTRVIAMQPTDPFGYWRRGEGLARAGRFAEALADLDHALELGPDENGAAHFARGTALDGLGDREGAIRSFDVAIQRSPANWMWRLRRFQSHKEAENWAACQIDADQLVLLLPDNPTILIGHARLCRTNNRREDARAGFERVVALEPGNAEAYHELAQVQQGFGDTLAARVTMARAFELSPDNPEIMMDYARDQLSYERTGEPRDRAMKILHRAVELDHENPEAWARAACHLRCTGYHVEALPYLDQALVLDPDNVDYLDERATCRLGSHSRMDPDAYRGLAEAALVDIERALEVAEEDDLLELYRHRASLREELGDLEGAIADHTKLMEIDPDFMDAYVDRATLRKRTGDMAGARADAERVRELEDAWREEVAHLDIDISRVARFNLDTA